MELSVTVLKQIILMFVYMTTGFLLYKKKLVTKQGSKELGMVLLYVILPVVIVKAYLIPFSAKLLKGLVLSFLASLLSLLLSMLLSGIVFRRKYTQAVKDICLSTILCIVTIPLIVTAAGKLL